MAILDAYSLSLAFGILGNVIGFLLFLGPIPTFYTIYKKKSSNGFQSILYIVALSSAMLLLYYGLIKTNATMIISINSVGFVIEVTDLVLFVFYACKQAKMAKLKLVLLFNVGYVLILFLTMFLLKEWQRVNIVGWICAAFSMAVFASPLSIMAKVVRTKSVEFVPINLSLFLVLCATKWFLYGLLIRDMFIAVSTHSKNSGSTHDPGTLPVIELIPFFRTVFSYRIIGFLLGISQMILYMIYKDLKTKNDEAGEKQIDNVKLNPCRIKPKAMGIINLVEKPEGPKVSNAVDAESGPERSE